MAKRNNAKIEFSVWPHRVAVWLVCATFPLIWVGGLVTTYDAGMAVPDWPTTYGYNLFLYPWQTWLLAPWDLFIEHGHRVLGAIVGLLAILLVVVVWRSDDRPWLQGVALAAVGLVIIQGALGGLRVLFDERQLAKLHGCIGPAFLALAVALAVFTSRIWRQAELGRAQAGAGTLKLLAVLTAALAYVQLVVGANLRHVSLDTSPSTFRLVVFVHLLAAAVVTALVILLTIQIILVESGLALLRPALALSLLIVLQLALGGATWVMSFSWPGWVAGASWASGFTIQAKGWIQANVVTAHMATGSLIVATAMQLALRSLRLLRTAQSAVRVPSGMQGAIA